MAALPYVWAEEWVDADPPSLAMAHSSVVLARNGSVITGAADEPALVFRDADGSREQLVPLPDVLQPHGLTLVEEGREELLWVADTATKLYGGRAELEVRRLPRAGAVMQVGLDGRTRRRLERPPLAAYDDVHYAPTAVAVDEPRHGGDGDVWVADGYGASLVHRYSRDGGYRATITGEEGAGRFEEPHDLTIDRRGAEPELYVADRRNGRIQVYDLDGRFKRVVGEGVLAAPTQLAQNGELLVVTDLLAGRVTLLYDKDRLAGHLFPNPDPPASWEALPDAWPNARGADGLLRRAALRRRAFHAPHGLAVASDGAIVVSEFAIGGRITTLRPRSGLFDVTARTSVGAGRRPAGAASRRRA